MRLANVSGQKTCPRLRVAYNPEFETELVPRFAEGEVFILAGVHFYWEHQGEGEPPANLNDDHDLKCVTQHLFAVNDIGEFDSDSEPCGVEITYDVIDQSGKLHLNLPDYLFIPVWGLNSVKE